MNRRQLLSIAAGASAGAMLPTAWAAGTAQAAGPRHIVWPIDVAGEPGMGTLMFLARLNDGEAGAASGGVAGYALGGPALFFFDGFGVVTFVRLVDRDLDVFEVYRTTAVTAGAIQGVRQRFVHSAAAQRYEVQSVAGWSIQTDGPAPAPLPLAQQPISVHGAEDFALKVRSYDATFTTTMREVLHGEDPQGRQLWGRVFGQSFVGYQQTDLFAYAPTGGTQYFSGRYAFIRALDPYLDRIQVYRGDHWERRDIPGPHFVHWRQGYKYGSPKAVVTLDTTTLAHDFWLDWNTSVYSAP